MSSKTGICFTRAAICTADDASVIGRFMAISSTNIRFRSADRDEVLGEMKKLESRRDGKAWFNLVPFVNEDDLIPENQLVKVFGAKGPTIPRGTWLPAQERRGKVRPGTVGLEHPKGRYAVRQLAELGVALPEGFETKQDHARRGLVFEIEVYTGAEAVLDFLIAATTALAEVPIGEGGSVRFPCRPDRQLRARRLRCSPRGW